MSPSPQAVIRLQGVSKVFPDVPPGTPPALSSLTADVPSGLVVGLVGPDAAGKTTLMRLLAGLLLPTSGSVEVLGRVPGSEASDEAVHDVGYMPQRFGLYEDLSVIDNLNLHAELRGLEGPARQAMFEKLLTFTALKPFTDRLAGKLSGGMKQKLGLACALLTTPRLLLLDEPGVGVDPLSRRELWKMVSELAVGGMSVLWSTAYMDEAERCAHVLMLDQGSLVYQGPPAGFTGRVAKRVFSFVPPSGEARAMLARWQQEPDIRDALIQGNRIRVVLRNPHDGPFSRKGVELHPVEPRLGRLHRRRGRHGSAAFPVFACAREGWGGRSGGGKGKLFRRKVIPFPPPDPLPSLSQDFRTRAGGGGPFGRRGRLSAFRWIGRGRRLSCGRECQAEQSRRRGCLRNRAIFGLSAFGEAWEQGFDKRKRLWKRRDGGPGEGRRKLFSRKVSPPFPRSYLSNSPFNAAPGAPPSMRLVPTSTAW